MTGERTYAHDVAFSFMQQDEPLALRFRAALAPLSSFVYSKMQEQLAGTDGMETFRAAFRTDSRLNVVLLRSGWGTTRWTRVEETAIKDRCFDEGFDSLLVVKVDKSANLLWCSDRKIYFDIEAFPFEQAVGAIKRQADQLGSVVRPPSPIEKAQSAAMAAEYTRETRELLGSDQGVRLADASVAEIYDCIERHLAEMGAQIPRWEPAFGKNGVRTSVGRLGACSAAVSWERPYSNTLSKSVLKISILDRHIATPQESAAGRLYAYVERPNSVGSFSFTVDRQPGLGLCWQSGSRRAISPAEVAGLIIESLAKAAQKHDGQGFFR
jgi:hypothetical protein